MKKLALIIIWLLAAGCVYYPYPYSPYYYEQYPGYGYPYDYYYPYYYYPYYYPGGRIYYGPRSWQ